MPSSLQARITRRAISPRLAMRIFLNTPYPRKMPGGCSKRSANKAAGRTKPEAYRYFTLPAPSRPRPALTLRYVEDCFGPRTKHGKGRVSARLRLGGCVAAFLTSPQDVWDGSIKKSGWPYSTGLVLSAKIFITRPFTSDSISFISFIASTMHKTWPFFRYSLFYICIGIGRRGAIEVPTIGDVIVNIPALCSGVEGD